MKSNQDFFKGIKKMLKNEYLTYFTGFFTILFVMEILNNPFNNLLVFLRFLLNKKIIQFLVVLLIISIGVYNIPLSFLLLTNLFFIMNIRRKVETFTNRIPDLVDKNIQISYKKNFAKPDKSSSEEEKVIKKTKEVSEEKVIKKTKEVSNEEEDKNYLIKYKDESLNTSNEERLDLDKNYDIKKELKLAKQQQEEEEEKENTLEEELVKKNYEIKKDLEILEEDISDSSDSSESEISESSESSASSDSEGLSEVNMEEAREHIMGKIRNKIKRKYVNKKKH